MRKALLVLVIVSLFGFTAEAGVVRATAKGVKVASVATYKGGKATVKGAVKVGKVAWRLFW